MLLHLKAGRAGKITENSICINNKNPEGIIFHSFGIAIDSIKT